MNFRNNFFQNNNVPGYQSPMGYSYNNQLHGRGGSGMSNTNVPMPNYMRSYDNQAAYPSRLNMGYASPYRGYMRSGYRSYMPDSYPGQSNHDVYGNVRALENNSRRARYDVASAPIAKERRKWSYSRGSLLGDSYNYDDYHDDPILRDEHSRKNYKSRFFTKLYSGYRRHRDEYDDERDTEFYSKRNDDIRSKKRSKSRRDEEYDDYEDEEDEEDYEDEKDGRKRKLKKRSKSRRDEEYDDYEDEEDEEDYEDEKDGRKRKLKKRSKSRYDEEYDDYDDDIYESRDRKSRFVPGPIDFFKKKRRV